MLRRTQIQADNVGRFAFELGIVAGQVTLQAVRFQAGFFPDPMHGVLADSQRCSQFAATPMRRTVAGFVAGGRQNSRSQSRSQNLGLLARMIGVQPIESGFEEALLLANDGGSSGLQPALNGVEGGSFCQHQDDAWHERRSRLAGNEIERCC
jgi:hypothetical protein